MPRRGTLGAGLVVAGLILGALGWAYAARDDGPLRLRASRTDGPADLATEATVRVAGRDVRVDLRWSGTVDAGEHFWVTLLDTRVVPPDSLQPRRGRSTAGRISIGSDGRLGVRSSDGEIYLDPAGHRPDMFGFPPEERGRASLSFAFTRDTVVTTTPEEDLALGMLLVDDGMDVLWARRVPLTLVGAS